MLRICSADLLWACPCKIKFGFSHSLSDVCRFLPDSHDIMTKTIGINGVQLHLPEQHLKRPSSLSRPVSLPAPLHCACSQPHPCSFFYTQSSQTSPLSSKKQGLLFRGGRNKASNYKILLGRMEKGKPGSIPTWVTSVLSQLLNTHAVLRLNTKSRRSESN